MCLLKVCHCNQMTEVRRGKISQKELAAVRAGRKSTFNYWIRLAI